MGIFDKPKCVEVITKVVDGLPIDENANVSVVYDENQVIINEVKLKVTSREIINTYRINFEKILDVIVATEKEIIEINKSVIKRGVVGAVLTSWTPFAPIAAILGGMSGIGSKKKTITKGTFLVISYMNKDNEIKNITFDVSAAFVKSNAQKFKDEVKKRIKRINNEPMIRNDIEL